MKPILAAAVCWAALSGCLMREGNYRNVGKEPHDWDSPGEPEEKVFGPLQFDQVKDFVREKESEGWGVIGYELASLPEDIMVDTTELDRPSPPKRYPWRFDIPKTMDDRVEAPRKGTIPPYVGEDVKAHRQKYLVIMRRWN